MAIVLPARKTGAVPFSAAMTCDLSSLCALSRHLDFTTGMAA
jgi:hypothetical protein